MQFTKLKTGVTLFFPNPFLLVYGFPNDQFPTIYRATLAACVPRSVRGQFHNTKRRRFKCQIMALKLPKLVFKMPKRGF